MALKTFLDAAHVRLGDRLTAVIAGRALSFRVVGFGALARVRLRPEP